MNRKIENMIQGFNTEDGAGVKLVRVLGNTTVDIYDPLLMLDSFDSYDPNDYIKGFPDHPHRGIETISYIYRGAMTHEDNMGNKDTITDGEVQWMTAGSGIIHAESLPPSERMLGVQLWLNLPAKDKMTSPKYKAIKNEEIEEIDIEGGMLRLLAGNYKDHSGYQGEYLPLDYYDIHIKENDTVNIETEYNRSITLFTLIGDIEVDGEKVNEKTAVKLSEGDNEEIKSLSDLSQELLISSIKLDEDVYWGGPIVMNTEEDLRQAFWDLRTGDFIKERVDY